MIPLRDDNPARLTPALTIALIVICSGVFLWQTSHTPEGQQYISVVLGTIPANVFGIRPIPPELSLIPPGLTLLTSMFLHGGWMHLLGNMLYLWIFGDNIEDILGHTRYLVFYITCGLIAVLAHALPNPESTVPMIGASGAISGVLGAYLVKFPNAKVLVLIPLGILTQLTHIRAIYVLGFWFVLQVINSLVTSTEGGGVAWGAHIGGFVAGMVLLPVFLIGARKKRSASG